MGNRSWISFPVHVCLAPGFFCPLRRKGVRVLQPGAQSLHVVVLPCMSGLPFFPHGPLFDGDEKPGPVLGRVLNEPDHYNFKP